jgi:hypothetical protein
MRFWSMEERGLWMGLLAGFAIVETLDCGLGLPSGVGESLLQILEID